VTEFGSLNYNPNKRVLNYLKTICLRFWKVVVQRVALIKVWVNNRCGNGTGRSEVKVGADTAKFTKMIVTRLIEMIFGQRKWDDYRWYHQDSELNQWYWVMKEMRWKKLAYYCNIS